MAYELIDWNLNPNILWFVKIRSGATGKVIVELFSTQADASAGTNLQASDELDSGLDLEVLLIAEAGVDISYFNKAVNYHLKINGVTPNNTKILKMNPFFDLPDINHGIYRSSVLIQRRAVNEINLHTHIAIKRAVSIANHIPTLKIGDVCQLNSTLRGMDVLTSLEELTIIGTPNSLINQIGTVEYKDLTYE